MRESGMRQCGRRERRKIASFVLNVILLKDVA
jgi:hypothetical protein